MCRNRLEVLLLITSALSGFPSVWPEPMPRSRFVQRPFADGLVIDTSRANLAGLQSVNVFLKFAGAGKTIKILQVKYLNNILERPSRGFQENPRKVTDHRLIKRFTAPMMGFKTCHPAQATIAGIKTANMIRMGQIPANWRSAFARFANLAA